MYNEDDYEMFSKKMEEQFPKIFSGAYGGFAVDPGWWPILEQLCAYIQHHIDWKNKQEEKCPQVVAEQIKEKFGGLRFYYTGGDDTIDGMVRMAEAWADYSCEQCGNPGKKRRGGWIKTLCDEHETERQQRYKERFE